MSEFMIARDDTHVYALNGIRESKALPVGASQLLPVQVLFLERAHGDLEAKMPM
jgi:hypothetical protein